MFDFYLPHLIHLLIGFNANLLDDRDLHPHKTNFVQSRFGEQDKFGEAEKTTRFWSSKAQTSLRHKLLHPSYNTGKYNAILLNLRTVKTFRKLILRTQ